LRVDATQNKGLSGGTGSKIDIMGTFPYKFPNYKSKSKNYGALANLFPPLIGTARADAAEVSN